MGTRPRIFNDCEYSDGIYFKLKFLILVAVDQRLSTTLRASVPARQARSSGPPHCCEQHCSSMKLAKSTLITQLAHYHLQDVILIASSNLQLDLQNELLLFFLKVNLYTSLANQIWSLSFKNANFNIIMVEGHGSANRKYVRPIDLCIRD